MTRFETEQPILKARGVTNMRGTGVADFGAAGFTLDISDARVTQSAGDGGLSVRSRKPRQ
jgi:hypothetical protein